MRLFLKLFCCGVMLIGSLGFTQEGPAVPTFPPKEDKDTKLPNGKSQKEEILKAEHQKSLEDAAQLVELSQALQKALENDTRHVLSLSTIKKTEEIEKIAKRIRGRMQRF